MHYLRRKIDTYLADWKKDNERKPIIIKGARQIGKTEAVINFAEKHYSNVVKINFAEEPKYKAIVQDGYTTDAIVKNITCVHAVVLYP